MSRGTGFQPVLGMVFLGALEGTWSGCEVPAQRFGSPERNIWSSAQQSDHRNRTFCHRHSNRNTGTELLAVGTAIGTPERNFRLSERTFCCPKVAQIGRAGQME